MFPFQQSTRFWCILKPQSELPRPSSGKINFPSHSIILPSCCVSYITPCFWIAFNEKGTNIVRNRIRHLRVGLLPGGGGAAVERSEKAKARLFFACNRKKNSSSNVKRLPSAQNRPYTSYVSSCISGIPFCTLFLFAFSGSAPRTVL